MRNTHIRFDADLYSEEVMQKAIYRVAHLCDVALVKRRRSFFVQINNPKNQLEVTDIQRLIRQHAVDYQLRECIAEKTEPIKNLVIGAAFSRILNVDSEKPC